MAIERRIISVYLKVRNMGGQHVVRSSQGRKAMESMNQALWSKDFDFCKAYIFGPFKHRSKNPRQVGQIKKCVSDGY